MKKSKRFVLGRLVMVLVFGLIMTGCASPANYYNFGNVSEENCAQIKVFPLSNGSDRYVVGGMINIDGQGSLAEWKPPIDGKSIVRVTPGTHTFTAKYGVRGSEPHKTISVMYDCETGKGYSFVFSNEGQAAEITLFEYAINENGKFGLLPKLVAAKHF